MNLVQIQERLKDLPMQAIMAYANGQNPQVPPYLALGELNRRKQMEQQTAEPPKATVKDNIEQQVGVMQLQKMQQGQPMGQPAMQQPQAPQPESMPEPEAEMAMAAGGLANLPVHMDFKSGGIIAFANPEGNQLVKDEAAQQIKEAQDRLDSYSNKTYKNLAERQQDTAAIQAAKAAIANAQARLDAANVTNQDTSAVGVMGKPIAPVTPPISRPTNTLTPQEMEMKMNPAPAEPPAAPPAPPAPPSAQNTGIRTLTNQQNVNANPVAPVVSEAQKTQEALLKGTGLPTIPTEWTPPKQAPIGEDYLKYMSDREQKRREDALKFEDVQKARDRRDFFNSLIEGGEETRGRRGIGALIGGTGKAVGRYATEAEDRRAAFEKAQQELADNDAKTRFEINNQRRAEERGDSKAVYDSKVKQVELANQRAQLQGTIANAMEQNASQERIAKANNLTHLEVARINQATAMKPGETERLMMQYGALKSKDPKAAEAWMSDLERIKTGSRGQTAQEKLNIARQQLAEKLPTYQMAINNYTNAKDATSKAQALTKIKELEALHGIKSEDNSTIDTSQWGNPRVSSK